MSKLFIGTSGWNYPHWAGGVFYPEGLSQDKWLRYYTNNFNAVELNVTFYRLVQKKTFQNWYKHTRKDFYFVVKGSRFITHILRLNRIKSSLNLFIDNVVELKEKLAAVLWQFPPSFKQDLKRLESFLKLLTKTKIRQVFEFRNESWFKQDSYSLLKNHNACLCIAHSSRFPCIKEVTADFFYLRFHGGGSLYSSNYTDKELKEWANFAKNLSVKVRDASSGKNKDVFAFFNNDAKGFAVKNAMRFREFLK
jgi:uncharacterized protein YecE (DUF72 family)